MSFLKMPRKMLIPITSSPSDIVRYGYDKQNKVILFVKSIISPHYIKKIKNYLFVIPNLKAKNEFLELQIQNMNKEIMVKI